MIDYYLECSENIFHELKKENPEWDIESLLDETLERVKFDWLEDLEADGVEPDSDEFDTYEMDFFEVEEELRRLFGQNELVNLKKEKR